MACVQALLAAGAPIDAFDHDGATALHAAAFNGQLGTILALVEAGSDANKTDNDNQSPRDLAVKEGHRDAAAYLREIGARFLARSPAFFLLFSLSYFSSS